MKWSLRSILPAVLLVLLLSVSALSLSLSLKQRLDDQVEGARGLILGDAARLVRLADQGQARFGTLVAAEVAQIASRPWTTAVMLVDDRGRILTAHQRSWRGDTLASHAPHVSQERLTRVSDARLPDVQMDAATHRLDVLQSFELPLLADELRSSRRGLVYIAYDLSELRADAVVAELRARAPDLAGWILVFLGVAWWLGRHVAAPLSALQLAAIRMREGDWQAAIPRAGFAEVKQLGDSIEALRQELDATWRAMPDLLFELDGSGRYLRAVTTRSDLSVGSPQGLIGRTIDELLPASAAQVVHQAIRDAATAGGVSGREIVLDVPAGRRWFEISMARKDALDGGAPTYLLISRDITSRRDAEDRLRALNNELEQRVFSRTAELLEAKNEAERANQSKSDFLSRMSHELRTPLNAILGFAQLLSLSASEARQQTQVRHILNAGQHLLTLINEVLDLARVESGHMMVCVEPVALADLVGECSELIRPLARDAEVTLAAEQVLPGLQVLADRTRLRQVLINLLSNGVKYNRPSGRLTVRASRHGGKVRIEVQDTGAGLTPEQQGRLFVPFERLGADQTSVEGTGIGLALSRRLVDLMGGELGVDSVVGAGSVFWVELPEAGQAGVTTDGLQGGAPESPEKETQAGSA